MSRNDITGDQIATKPASDAFREGFDRIFRSSPAHGPAKGCGCEPGMCRATDARECKDWIKRGEK